MVRSLYDKYQLLNALTLMLRYFTSMCDIRTAHELTIPGNLREVEPLSEGTAFKHRRGDACGEPPWLPRSPWPGSLRPDILQWKVTSQQRTPGPTE